MTQEADDDFWVASEQDKLTILRLLEYSPDIIDQHVQREFYKAFPAGGVVYHYTSPEGFRSIIDSNTLWASQAVLLNDRNELQDGIRVIREVIKSGQSDFSDESLDRIRRLRGLLCLFFESKFSPKIDDIYTISFCEHGDIASQWMNYSGKQAGVAAGRGFSIGLPAANLAGAARPLRYKFAACRYERKSKAELVGGALDVAVKYLGEMLDAGFHRSASIDWVADRFFYALLPMLPFFKDHTFLAEFEWRVAIVPGVAHSWDRGKVSSGDSTREVIKFCFPAAVPGYEGYKYLPIVDVVAGPGMTSEEVSEYRQFLAEAGYSGVQFRASESGLR